MSIPKCNVWVLRAPHPLVSTLPININRLSYVGCAGRSQPQNYFDIQGLFFILLSTVMSQVISKRAWWERAGLIIRNFHSRRWASMIHFKWSIQLESRALAVLNIGDDRLSACVPLCLSLVVLFKDGQTYSDLLNACTKQSDTPWVLNQWSYGHLQTLLEFLLWLRSHFVYMISDFLLFKGSIIIV